MDTGCSTTILDTDLAEEIGLFLDLEHAISRRMYGVGGTEICIEQKVRNLSIGGFGLTDYIIQLGDMRDMHGFNGILGSDFLIWNSLVIDFKKFEIRTSN